MPEQLETSPITRPAASTTTTIRMRPSVRGKFLFAGEEKLYIRGVTYGTFRASGSGDQFPNPEVVQADFAAMAANGINTVRTYTVPPRWLLDEAADQGLYVMTGIPWEQHIAFLDDRARCREIRTKVQRAVRECERHPAILCYAIGNEIPASIVRWHGPQKIQAFLKSLYECAKSEDSAGLVTYVNFPTTEYLELDFLDFASFNVYLESEDRLSAYLARLQTIAGERPLIMAEVGLDSRRNGLVRQAEVLDWQIRTVFSAGCAGMFVFAWTDEWHRGGFDIDDWDFGLVRRDRRPKAALQTVREAFENVPFRRDVDWPRMSVVVCSYNGSRTIRETLEHLNRLAYPNYEVIVVDDGSTDRTAEIASEFDVRLITIENGGLSNARNVGMRAATGEIVAYCDDDAYPDPHWLNYLAHTYATTAYAGAGGPNLPPPGDGRIADAIANAPGGPIHVLLSDTEAEHIPGCNSSYRRSCLMAVGGYDPAFRVAGDDVDLCWRIQNAGWKIGFHPAAVVWHHRRNSIQAYWRQQRGYGKAEALLERKWPEKYNSLGHLSWLGRVYSTGTMTAIARRWRVYYGTWGTALFQSLYESPPGASQVLVRMPEWYFVSALLAVLTLLGVAWHPLLALAPLTAIAAGLPLAQVIAGARRAVFANKTETRLARFNLCSLTALLFILQPLARLWGRIAWGLAPWRLARGCGFRLPRQRSATVWSEQWRSYESWLENLEGVLRERHAWVTRGGHFDRWDLQVQGGIAGGVRITMAVEEHGAGKQLARFRLRPVAPRIAGLVVTLFAVLAISAGVDGSSLAAFVLGAIAVAVCAWVLMSCGFAMGSSQGALQRMREGIS